MRLFVCTALFFNAHLVSIAAVYNLKVVTDASPDYSDLSSLVQSATSKWNTPEEKCWAMFYWNHIARRQTAPMNLHGMALTDPAVQRLRLHHVQYHLRHQLFDLGRDGFEDEVLGHQQSHRE